MLPLTVFIGLAVRQSSRQYTGPPMQAGPVVPHSNDVFVDAVALQRQLVWWSRQAQPPWLHLEVARRMADRLPLFKKLPARVLQWWPKVGGGEALLHAAYPQARWLHAHPAGIAAPDNVGAPPRWWQRIAASPPAKANFDDNAVPPDACDLLWANMTLHAAPDRRNMVQAWRDALSIDGVLMFSTLGPDTARELRAVYRDRAWGDFASPLVDMHDVGDDLVRAGFADPVMDQELLTLHWADTPSMLRELRTLGRNTSPRRHPGLRTPRWRADLDARMAPATADGRVSMTFEIVYGHAFKTDPGVTSIDVDALRQTLPSRRRSRR